MTKEEILAMNPSIQLGDLVAIEVMEWRREGNRREGNHWTTSEGFWVKAEGLDGWYPWRDISAAWRVVDRMFELGYAMSLLHLSSEFYPEYWYCDFRPKDSNRPPEYEWVDHQPTAPVAISKAALLTIHSQNNV